MRAKTDRLPELKTKPWYVDDSVLKCKRNKAQMTLAHLNEVEPSSSQWRKKKTTNWQCLTWN